MGLTHGLWGPSTCALGHHLQVDALRLILELLQLRQGGLHAFRDLVGEDGLSDKKDQTVPHSGTEMLWGHTCCLCPGPHHSGHGEALEQKALPAVAVALEDEEVSIRSHVTAQGPGG